MVRKEGTRAHGECYGDQRVQGPVMRDLEASDGFGPYPLDNGERFKISEERLLLRVPFRMTQISEGEFNEAEISGREISGVMRYGQANCHWWEPLFPHVLSPLTCLINTRPMEGGDLPWNGNHSPTLHHSCAKPLKPKQNKVCSETKEEILNIVLNGHIK